MIVHRENIQGSSYNLRPRKPTKPVQIDDGNDDEHDDEEMAEACEEVINSPIGI